MNKFLNVKTLFLSLFAGLVLSSCGVSHTCQLSCGDVETACISSCHKEKEATCNGCGSGVCSKNEYATTNVVQEVVATECIKSCHEKDCLQDCSDCQTECVKSCRDNCITPVVASTPIVQESLVAREVLEAGECIKACHEKDCLQDCSDCQTECVKSCKN